jgi:GTP pyrophosphokinase
VIKLADRLHNMKTIKFLRPDKQVRIARETLDIYAPLAHRIGMASLKWELEDLSFMILEPESFQEIKHLVVTKREERQQYIDRVIESVNELFIQHDIKAEVKGRPKHFYSIYKKLLPGDTSFDELYDMLGIRVIVTEIQECYAVLGLIHSAYTPVPGRFKDYIAVPKSNMYQSLHTTIVGPEGKPVEVQIRTRDMHRVAELGIAAHWQYKEGHSNTKPDKEFVWLRQMMEMHHESESSTDFLRDLKMDLFQDEVFVFTPNGEVKILTQGATALDFAFAVHTQVGYTCVGAKVNGHMVSLGYELKNGDQLEILTSKQQKPNSDWLTFVRSSKSRAKIKQWLKRQMREELVEAGRQKVDSCFKVEGITLDAFIDSDAFKEVKDKYRLQDIEHLYLFVGQGEISVREVIRKLVQQPPVEEVFTELKSAPKSKSGEGVVVMGEKGIAVTFAKCCSPLPGDDIEGIVTLGKGVSVHRSDCKNFLDLDDEKKSRVVSVAWDTGDIQHGGVYYARLIVESFDRVGVMQDILRRISDMNVNITEMNTKSHQAEGTMEATLMLELHNATELSRVKLAIQQISDVYAVRRG